MGRFSELDEGLQPVFSTETLACRGISAEVYRVGGERTFGPFVFDDICLAFLHKGTISANFELASLTHTFSYGAMWVLPPASAATLRLSDVDCTIVYLRPDQIPGVAIERIARLEIVPQIDPKDIQAPFLVGCIREELQTGLPGGAAFMESLGLAVINHLFARYAIRISSRKPFRGGLTARQVRRAQQTMMAAMDENMPLAALAEDAGLSPWYFCRAFRQSTGLSPHRWMREKRLEQARHLLADGRRSLTSIAVDLGYASLSHFSAAFKQATGISPTLYRRNLLG